MRNIIFVLVFFIVGCATKTVQPQKFFDGDISMENTSVLINQYSTGNLITLIAKIDEMKVGDSAYGSTGISELYVRPGKHKLNVISTSLVNGVKNYSGNITCTTAPGRFYTIDFNDNGESIGTLTMDLIFNSKLNVGQIKVSCVEHSAKPENRNLAGKTFKNEVLPAPN